MKKEHLRKLALTDVIPAAASDRPRVVWSSPSGAAMSPAQVIDDWGQAGAEALALIRDLREREAEMTTDFIASTDSAGVGQAGLEYRMKSPQSLARKLKERAKNRGLSLGEAAEQVQDLIRYTAVCHKHTDLVSKAKAVTNELTARGWTVLSVENSYVDGHPYKGIHLNLEKSGFVTEVQIHSKQSLAVKESTHADYEISRDARQGFDDRREAEARSVAAWREVTTPRGLGSLTLGGVKVQVKKYSPVAVGVEGRSAR